MGMAVIVLAVWLIGCGCCVDQAATTIGVDNKTGAALRFEIIGPGGKPFPKSATIKPGLHVLLLGVEVGEDGPLLKDGCTVGEVIARDLAGREIARRPPPLCLGDVWVVTSPAPS